MNAYTLMPLGQTALQITFGDTIDIAINRCVHAAWLALHRAALPGVANLVPAYATLTVLLDPLAVLRGTVLLPELEKQVRLTLTELDIRDFNPRRIELSVRYNGPDLAHVCAHTGLTEAEVIRLHSEGIYDVYFLGFSPGFAYLGGLAPELATPRLEMPRVMVPAGSVAIGGAQTAVYPQATPGGWNLIGHCPEILFDPKSEEPCRLQPGDQVVFVPVGASC
ncbi:MAG: 5-oxoprolinase subunit PxpB [Fluviicoccus sp.]|uniref:5-oxoprolinase subunit PxpB n=1 Tax=Fluviicoccus sp. TaxID=2003552 RepID=UPI00271D41E3|nr:5-oxoprolinase subunit PxpB [Fluviicoccus sp.]MDO8330420.1 5-oxoprolinase subunit PxpB [Fluviicoccus sp.]